MEVFLIKIWKKNRILWFSRKKFVNFWQTRSIFQTVIQDMFKMTILTRTWHNFWKSQEFSGGSCEKWQSISNERLDSNLSGLGVVHNLCRPIVQIFFTPPLLLIDHLFTKAYLLPPYLPSTWIVNDPLGNICFCKYLSKYVFPNNLLLCPQLLPTIKCTISKFLKSSATNQISWTLTI